MAPVACPNEVLGSGRCACTCAVSAGRSVHVSSAVPEMLVSVSFPRSAGDEHAREEHAGGK